MAIANSANPASSAETSAPVNQVDYRFQCAGNPTTGVNRGRRSLTSIHLTTGFCQPYYWFNGAKTCTYCGLQM